MRWSRDYPFAFLVYFPWPVDTGQDRQMSIMYSMLV